MSRLGVVILLIAIALSIGVTAGTHGRFIFIGLPLLFGVPLAGWFGRRER